MIGVNLSRRSGIRSNRRPRQPWPAGREFRILSIDGGGIKGILPASILAELEARHCPGDSIGRCFDLIAGTSTGGILALGLGAGFAAAEMRDLYLERGREIFPHYGWPGRAWLWGKHWVWTRRSRAALDRVLDEQLGGTLLGESAVRLCIPTASTKHDGEIWVYKTPHHPDYRRDWKETMADVAKATSAAPTYLAPHRTTVNEFIDGGLWANNPILVAVVEALSAFELDPRQIRVLSLGCGETAFTIGRLQRMFGGLCVWASKAVEAALHYQGCADMGRSMLLLGADRITRVSPPASTIRVDLDDWHGARSHLPDVARRLLGHEDLETAIARDFLDGGREPFQPIYGPRSSASAGPVGA